MGTYHFVSPKGVFWVKESEGTPGTHVLGFGGEVVMDGFTAPEVAMDHAYAEFSPSLVPSNPRLWIQGEPQGGCGQEVSLAELGQFAKAPADVPSKDLRLVVAIRRGKEEVLFSAEGIAGHRHDEKTGHPTVIRMRGVTLDRVYKAPFVVECPEKLTHPLGTKPRTNEPTGSPSGQVMRIDMDNAPTHGPDRQESRRQKKREARRGRRKKRGK